MPGAYKKKFTLIGPTQVQIMLDVRLFLSASIDEGDDLDAMISIDGKAIGIAPGRDFIAQLRGNNGDKVQDTGYKTITVNVGTLSGGSHELAVGGFLLVKNQKEEIGKIFYKNVMVKIGSFAPVALARI